MVLSLFPRLKQRLQLLTPDLREEHGDQVLLVWGDLPHWVIVDKDFEACLQEFDGTKTLDAILKAHAEWSPFRKLILSQVKTLTDVGVLVLENRQVNRPTPETKIENIALNITMRCNLRCRFCYNLPFLNKQDDHEISAEQMIEFTKSLRPWLAKQPTLTILGGEPLLVSDKLLEVASFARQQGFVTIVSTNGTQITDSFAKQAAEIGMQVQVSLDGPTPELHEAVRGKGNYEKAIKGIETLVRHNVHTTISMVCHRENISSLEDFFLLALSLGVNQARFIPLKRLGGATEGSFEPIPLAELLKSAFTILKNHPEFLSLLGTDAFSITANTCRYSTRRPSCGTGLQTVLLNADGSLYPCLNTNRPEFRFGSVLDKDFDFSALWQQSTVLSEVRKHTAVAETDNPHSRCPVRYWCLGGCRGENYSLTGKLDGLPHFCAELRQGIIAMFWMLAERPELAKPIVKTC